jgi:hypothetical protein
VGVAVEVDTGEFHSMARRSDGSVVAWGENSSGQCDVPALPAGLTYVEIAGGGYHSLARRSDGSVVAWGSNAYGQCNVPPLPAGLSCVELAAGGDRSAARLSDGSVVVWGASTSVPALAEGFGYLAIDLSEMGFIVALYSSPCAPTSYCTAGTSASGCEALLSATGTASASAATGFTLQASGVEGGKDGLFFWGTNGRQANSWGNGTSFQCVVPPVKRGGLLAGAGSIGACNGSFAQDLDALWCPTCPKPAANPGAGAVVDAQLWYRDPASTSNQKTSLSDAIEFCVEP